MRSGGPLRQPQDQRHRAILGARPRPRLPLLQRHHILALPQIPNENIRGWQNPKQVLRGRLRNRRVQQGQLARERVPGVPAETTDQVRHVLQAKGHQPGLSVHWRGRPG